MQFIALVKEGGIRPFGDEDWNEDFEYRLLVKVGELVKEEGKMDLGELFGVFESIFMDKCPEK